MEQASAAELEPALHLPGRKGYDISDLGNHGQGFGPSAQSPTCVVDGISNLCVMWKRSGDGRNKRTTKRTGIRMSLNLHCRSELRTGKGQPALWEGYELSSEGVKISEHGQLTFWM